MLKHFHLPGPFRFAGKATLGDRGAVESTNSGARAGLGIEHGTPAISRSPPPSLRTSAVNAVR